MDVPYIGLDALSAARPRQEVQNRRKERNRIHARKTRERKKLESIALQQRIDELHEENKALCRLVDERYTADVLLGLKKRDDEDTGGSTIVSSVQICRSGAFEEAAANNALVGMGDHGVSPGDAMRRSRNRVKCTPQERLRMRRERNRLHAKKTRDRKKWFLEASERTIAEMEQEVQAMRSYLVSVNLMSAQDVQKYKERDSLSKRQLALLKVARCQYDAGDHEEHEEEDQEDQEDQEEQEEEEEEEDMAEHAAGMSENGDGDDEESNASQEEYEAKGSWGGSNDREAFNGYIQGGSSSNTSAGGQTTSASSSSSSSARSRSNRGSSSNDGDSGGGNSREGSRTGSISGSYDGSHHSSHQDASHHGSNSSCSSSNNSSGGDSPIPEEDERSRKRFKKDPPRSFGPDATSSGHMAKRDRDHHLADMLLQFR